MASGLPVMKSGTYTGTTAALTVQVGFRPNSIIAWNQTDSAAAWWWSDQMAATTVSNLATGATIAESVTVTDHGFTVPASGSITNVNGKVYIYMALRDGSN